MAILAILAVRAIWGPKLLVLDGPPALGGHIWPLGPICQYGPWGPGLRGSYLGPLQINTWFCCDLASGGPDMAPGSTPWGRPGGPFWDPFWDPYLTPLGTHYSMHIHSESPLPPREVDPHRHPEYTPFGHPKPVHPVWPRLPTFGHLLADLPNAPKSATVALFPRRPSACPTSRKTRNVSRFETLQK